MAYLPKLVIAVFLLVALSSITYGRSQLGGLIPIPSKVASVSVLGRLVCTATGNVEPGSKPQGIGGANVEVRCNNGTLNLGTLTTNATGFFEGVLRSAQGVLFTPSDCRARVALPVGNCNVLPPTGVLQSVLTVGGLINTILGLVAALLAGPWQVIAV